MTKKHDLPAMPFYVGDWRKAPDIRSLSLEERALWFEMLCLMWESPRRGYLTIDGTAPIDDETLGRMIGEHSFVITKIKHVLASRNVFSVEEETNILFNRRMVRDEKIRESRSTAGSYGMSVRYKKEGVCYNKTLNKVVTKPEDENEDESVIEYTDRIEEKREESIIYIQEIIDDFNVVFKSNYKVKSKKTQELIRARMKEGFTVEDFKVVHRKMAQRWGHDDKMAQYLRPITLYSPKFESYLNAKEGSTQLGEAGTQAYLVGQEWLRKRRERNG